MFDVAAVKVKRNEKQFIRKKEKSALTVGKDLRNGGTGVPNRARSLAARHPRVR